MVFSKRFAHIAIIAIVVFVMGFTSGYLLKSPEVITTTTTITTTHYVQRLLPISVIDALGMEVTFEEIPSKVVSLAPSITEILFALGLDDKVVGVDEYSNYPPKLLKMIEEGKIKIIGGYWNPDVEKIIALKPDLVIGSAGTKPHVELKEKLSEIGVKVVYVRGSGASNAHEIYSDIRTIAKIFNVEEKANEVIKNIDAEISEVVNKLQKVNVTKLKVLLLIGPPSWGLFSAGKDTFIGWVIESAGGINIASKYSGWPQLDYEYILAQDPDVIIIAVHGLNATEIFKEIENTPLTKTKAFKEGKLYVVDQEANDILMRPGPRVDKAVKLIAKILYPDIFGVPDVPTVHIYGIELTGSQQTLLNIPQILEITEATTG